MSKQYKNGRCSCWKSINETLRKEGSQLGFSFTMTGHEYLQVTTENVGKSRKKPSIVVASHCPFCGSKLK